jgi:hypothetical protein
MLQEQMEEMPLLQALLQVEEVEEVEVLFLQYTTHHLELGLLTLLEVQEVQDIVMEQLDMQVEQEEMALFENLQIITKYVLLYQKQRTHRNLRYSHHSKD